MMNKRWRWLLFIVVVFFASFSFIFVELPSPFHRDAGERTQLIGSIESMARRVGTLQRRERAHQNADQDLQSWWLWTLRDNANRTLMALLDLFMTRSGTVVVAVATDSAQFKWTRIYCDFYARSQVIADVPLKLLSRMNKYRENSVFGQCTVPESIDSSDERDWRVSIRFTGCWLQSPGVEVQRAASAAERHVQMAAGHRRRQSRGQFGGKRTRKTAIDAQREAGGGNAFRKQFKALASMWLRPRVVGPLGGEQCSVGAALLVRVFDGDEALDSYARHRQWIEYHRMIGVSHVLVYDNAHSRDEVLEHRYADYVRQGVVRYVRWWGVGAAFGYAVSQRLAYVHALYSSRNDGQCRWLLQTDVDEYLVLRRHATVSALIAAHSGDGGGSDASSLMMRNSFVGATLEAPIRTDIAVVEQYVWRNAAAQPHYSRSKVIINVAKVHDVVVHQVIDPTDGKLVELGEALIYHYWMQRALLIGPEARWQRDDTLARLFGRRIYFAARIAALEAGDDDESGVGGAPWSGVIETPIVKVAEEHTPSSES
jgi:Glycosyltransferase family 92